MQLQPSRTTPSIQLQCSERQYPSANGSQSGINGEATPSVRSLTTLFFNKFTLCPRHLPSLLSCASLRRTLAAKPSPAAHQSRARGRPATERTPRGSQAECFPLFSGISPCNFSVLFPNRLMGLGRRQPATQSIGNLRYPSLPPRPQTHRARETVP
jgi:hypothetical protein